MNIDNLSQIQATHLHSKRRKKILIYVTYIRVAKNNVFIYIFLFTSVAHNYRYLFRFFISKYEMSITKSNYMYHVYD